MAEFTAKTIADLEPYVKAPKLSEKLLSKPPFRYLYDIVLAFMKETGFPAGLYPDAMLDPANVDGKESKIEFLTLLIAAVDAATGQTCEAKPQKIVAGKEPEHTNAMLQLLASCATLSAEKKAAAVAKANGHGTAPAAPAPETKPDKKEKDAEPKKAKEKRPKDEKDGAAKERPSGETEEARRQRHEEERRKRHEERKREAAEEETRRRTREEEGRQASAEDTHRGSGQFSRGSAKEPTTAGKAPPRTKPTHEVVASQSAVSTAPAVGVITEAKRRPKGSTGKGAEDEDADEAAEDWMKVAERYEQKPAAQTAGVAADVEVKGKLGQQALKAKRDQEEATQQAAAAAGPSSGGGIVISKGRGGARGARGASGATMNDTELQKLREQLQLLTRASNPLGKFLEATHDDIDSMTRELETWRSEARNQAMAAAEARRQTQESLQEIQAQLQSMEDAISDQMLKTNNLRKTILANDAAIEGMLGMIVGPDAAAR